MAGMTVAVLLLVAGVALMFALHVLVVVWAIRRGAASREARERAAAAGGLTAEEIRELPCQDFKAGATGECCAVCLEALQAGDRCRVLPGCQHGFHAQCVDSWLCKSRLCPVCRAVVQAPGRRGKASDEAAATEVVAGRLGGAELQIGSEL
ncbi:E3 ubiquitin-protein ligase ATL23 [Brachypodium distachyon]|uniref:RING-type domain-containing protein n=1 Tax=Brachypodium distachyon TaxID=15368 RepID=A0A0Q3JSS1_BRADI|nr:E3 ubiquitin-protein ligase ATL23 [Brachypodium distachyon]KQK01489.1 hypothetical protein BRADI_3g56170v3 [Brachypodium distachyon]|eukprot:XP_024316355.1 E3 ubiquitin-protein ligase ATL23 [Brachypodium distachyon]